ncbi:MAG: hypothetical protein E6J34_17645 [Chloroflexi bacterium]|nr:MAG: hypothetical protein E6J34_17645 [Chloroflexota bacterium]
MLITEIKKVVSSSCQGLSPDAQLKDLRPDLCHTFVVSSRLRATGGAIRMRTYDTLTEDAFPACIWQAARATSAAPTFFPSILIDDDRYGDGGTGWNNPTKEAIAEVHNIWPTRSIGCVISIGTGLEEALQLNDKSEELSTFIDAILRKTSPKLSFQVAVAEYCVKCLTSCEITHREVADNPERIILDGNYFRLNVPQGMSKIGLDEWDKLEDMIALTKSYMTHPDLSKLKQKIAKLLQNPQIASLSSV